MSYATVQDLLDTRLLTVVDLPTLQKENTRNLAVSGQRYTRSTLLPGRATQTTIGTTGKDIVRGLYQVDLFYPLDGGVFQINSMADSVVAAFPRGTALFNGMTIVNIVSAWREAGARVEPYYSIPVVVEWYWVK